MNQIQLDHRTRMKTEEPLSINILTENEYAGKSTTDLGGQFFYSQLLIDYLLRLKSNEIDKNELIILCQQEYKGNQSELNILNEFQHEYSADKVLWWYTRESFFYKMLNKALRTLNIDVLFLFRSYIFDIYVQLQKYQSDSLLHVYRSQLMSSNEINELRNHIGKRISINSFFSATTSLQIVDLYSGTGNPWNDLGKVLFEIDADPRFVNEKPFADISSHSYFPSELEVLFMPGCIFRLISIVDEMNQRCRIRMALCIDDDHDLKAGLDDLKGQNENEEIDLILFANFLQNFGKFDLAEKYLHRFLKQLSSNDFTISTVYERLSRLSLIKGDSDGGIEWLKKAKQFKEQFRSNNITINHSLNRPCRGTLVALTPTARWSPNAITVAGGHNRGAGLDELCYSWGLCVHDDGTVYVADQVNHRIVAWSPNAKQGQIVAGGNGDGDGLHQIGWPRDVIIDQTDHDYLIICDRHNRRIVRWPRTGGKEGQVILRKIYCWGLTMDNRGFIYVADTENHVVRRFHITDSSQQTWVAGGNGQGNALNQLNTPSFLFVDQDYCVYVSDDNNHRVMKWPENAQEGILVASGHVSFNNSKELRYPRGVLVDLSGTVYVADSGNGRVTRWRQGAVEGNVVAGGNGIGKKANQLSGTMGLTFDRDGDLYVVDHTNSRVQKFQLLSV